MKLLFKGPVIITGGSSQLGMALARALREEGAKTLCEGITEILEQ